MSLYLAGKRYLAETCCDEKSGFDPTGRGKFFRLEASDSMEDVVMKSSNRSIACIYRERELGLVPPFWKVFWVMTSVNGY
jgi:hypothetical protein